MTRSQYLYFVPLGLHTRKLETALPHFLHPIASLIDHALGYVLAYLRSLDWVLTRRPCSYLYEHCTTRHSGW